MKWYYSTGADPVGPHSANEIENLFATEEIGADTLVWRKGLADWATLADTEEFAGLLDDAALPAVPSGRQQITERKADDHLGGDRHGDDDLLVDDRAADDRLDDRRGDDGDRPGKREPAFDFAAATVAPILAGPWTRYFARSIDLTIIISALSIGVYWVLPAVDPKHFFNIHLANPLAILLWLLPLALFINVCIITLSGNSLGKAIFAIRAEPIAGPPRFTFWGNLKREFRVWAQGLALGIPLFSAFTMVWAFRTVLRGAPATYDLGRATVRAYSQSGLRRTLGMLFALALYVGVAALGVLDRAMDQRAQPVAQSVIWTNPTTGLATAIPAGWTYEQVTGPEGTPLHGFTNLKTGLVGFFAVETMPNMDMAGYLRALTQGMSASATLGDWSMSPHPGVWTASGQFTTQGYPTSAYAAQNGNQFWRIMYVDQFSKTPRVIAEPELTEALFRSAGIDVAQ